MNFHLPKIKVLDLVAAIIILSVSLVVVFFAFDPREAANKKHDSMYGPTAKTIQNALADKIVKTGKPVEASVAFDKGSVVLKKFDVYDEFSKDTFIVSNIDNFFIGKEKGINASFYVCYVPESIFLRDSRCSDSFVYTLNSDGTRTPVKCDVKSKWQLGNNPWVVCYPN